MQMISKRDQLDRLKSPNDQKTIVANCTLSAIYCRAAMPAPKKELIMIPARITISELVLRHLATINMNNNPSNDVINENRAMVYGLSK